MRRKRGTLLLGSLLVIGLLSGCGASSRTPESGSNKAEAAGAGQGKRVIRIAHQNDAPTILGRKKGWFEEEFGKDGTTVTYTQFVAGPPIMESFSAGRQDVGYTGDMPPVAARATGVDVKAVAVSGRTVQGNTTVVLKESPIKSVEDLQGKKLAAQVGSSQYHYALLLLNQKGLTGKVNLVNIPLTELRTALESKAVDAIVSNEYLAGTLEHEGTGRVLEDSLGVKPGLGFYLVRGEFAEQNPDLVQRWLKVIARVNQYLVDNPDEAAEIVSKENRYPEPVLSQIFKQTDYGLPIKEGDVRQLETIRDFLLETKVIKKGFDVNSLIDLQHLQAAGLAEEGPK